MGNIWENNFMIIDCTNLALAYTATRTRKTNCKTSDCKQQNVLQYSWLNTATSRRRL